MMEVNFHGMVRCTKKFLPLFKRQASEGIYSGARIVNMVSIAGLMKGGLLSVGYEASKHAADVFTTNLRLEIKKFGLKVSVINPSFHKTPLTHDMTAVLKETWDALTPEKRGEYGEGKRPCCSLALLSRLFPT
jgi:NAD(P)-dependent dehydrogenase (short-subunit alcohol dehydrogenase family)